MPIHTGVPFVMTEFLANLQNIGKRSEPPDQKVVTGYFVDGNYVTVGRLQHYLRHYGGESLDVVMAVI